ncbi:cupin domain-containing protein [Desulfatitalea alkaliphila]|uniref:Cupin domain-containing protein n=1 Tax=Desulfatitalea alkaliphila TaxID=2929485 RepID=A0AA41UKS7_9BACT|nr:cupin domain-containing protein [Desulfatitalea alkaliphila]MCJ8501747.1 cupin domain-containing protein [Desulfatitalea alkaliphila]
MSSWNRGNLFEGIPADLPEEWLQTMWADGRTRIERIVSRGHRSEAGFWYDQEWDEWVVVIKGAAELVFAGCAAPVAMGPGDWVRIPARTKHRVSWTDPDQETVWLAIHMMPSVQ